MDHEYEPNGRMNGSAGQTKSEENFDLEVDIGGIDNMLLLSIEKSLKRSRKRCRTSVILTDVSVAIVLCNTERWDIVPETNREISLVSLGSELGTFLAPTQIIV